MKTAVDVLAVVAGATENVPYLGAISKALTVFKDVLDVSCLRVLRIPQLTAWLHWQEVSVCKEDCEATVDDAKSLRDFIQKYEAKWDQLESDGDEGLRDAFDDLGRYVCLHSYIFSRLDPIR